MSDAPKQESGSKSASESAEETPEASKDAKEPHGPQPCMPCHGSGQVISNLGGHSQQVTCPWCRGGGVRLTGVDAQEWQQEQAAQKRH
jgi:DnaJ-class molecular chaperone